VCYSPVMKTATAPDLSPGYPSKGTKIGPAWAEVWTRLAEEPGEWVDGAELWKEIAPRHGLSPLTLRALMFRMAAGQVVEKAARKVTTPRGIRTRASFRMIPKEN
jgi:hypothetical protein